MSKPVIVHLINQMGLGGAEVLLTHTLPLLSDYDNVLCSLLPLHHTASALQASLLSYCLDHRSMKDTPRSVLRLRRILRKHRPAILHTHLRDSTLIGRLACPASTEFAFSVHSTLSQDAFIPYPKSLLLEKLTMRRRHNLIAVSETVREDYIRYTGFRGRSFVLHNFIPDEFFRQPAHLAQVGPKKELRCVSVGNLKEAKNHPFVLEAMRQLRGLPISLDIYGDGDMRGQLQHTIDKEGLAVRLMGAQGNLSGRLATYDVSITASLHEGYGLAVIEAMASGLPAILSDIPVFREVSGGHAMFIDLSNPDSLAVFLRRILEGDVPLNELIRDGYIHAQQIAGKEHYIRGLKNIYEVISSGQH